MDYPTHAIIDGAIHEVASVEPAHPHALHTHRVKFACGLGFDVWGERQFAEHAVTGARNASVDHPEVASTRQAADAAAKKLADVRERYYAARDEWDGCRRQHLEAVEYVKLFNYALEVDIPLKMDVYREYLDVVASTAEKLAELKPAWDKHVAAEQAAHDTHAHACADHHAARARHEAPDQRWIAGGAPDRTTCRTCKETR